MCSATSINDDGLMCEDQGNLNNDVSARLFSSITILCLSFQYYGGPQNNPYTKYDTDRLQFNVRDNMCGLTINRPHANDTGEWKCIVTDNDPEGSQTSMWR